MHSAHDRVGVRRLRWLAFAAAAVYALVVCVAAFEHHDLDCELKTPQHCTACTVSVLSANPDTPAVAGAWHLVEAGRTVAADVRAESLLLADRSTGRSPPAAI